MVWGIENFFAKLLEFFGADCSDGFGDGFARFFVSAVDVEEFIEWHDDSSVECNSLGYQRCVEAGPRRVVRAKKVIDHIGDSREAVHTAEFGVDAFVAEPIPH